MHHICFCIMPCVCGGCLLCCLFLSGLLLSLASVSFRSCEDSFDYVRLSTSWTRSSSLRDLRQDDHTLEITSIFACQLLALLLCLCCDTYHLLIVPPILLNQASNPPCPSKLLFGYVTAFAQPLLQRCQLQVKMKNAPCWIMFMLGYHNISYLINASIYLVKGGRLGLMPGVLFHKYIDALIK